MVFNLEILYTPNNQMVLSHRAGFACGDISRRNVSFFHIAEDHNHLQDELAFVGKLKIFMQIFMLMGVVLFAEAVLWLRRNWHALSKPIKVTSVYMLATGSIGTAYIFHWLIPDLMRHREPPSGNQK